MRFSPFTLQLMNNVSFNGLSAGEIAEWRARWLLLAEKPKLPAPQNSWGRIDSWAEQHIIGRGAESEPILPALWKKVEGNAAKFKVMAPLVVLSRLLQSGVCDAIEEIQIGPVSAGKARVHVQGTRASNGVPMSIEVEGVCPLDFERETPARNSPGYF